MTTILCNYLGMTAGEIEALLALEPEFLLASPAGRRLISDTDMLVLQATFPEAQECMQAALPQFYAWLRQSCSPIRIPASPDHAIEWVGDFLVGQQEIGDLLQSHMGLSSELLSLAAPRMIAIFDTLSFGREVWQRAMSLLCLVLLAAAQHEPMLANPTQRADR